MENNNGDAKWQLEQIGKRGNLVASLAHMLERQIVEGQLQAGDRLPTEAQLAASTGVSRTVVREAVASLRAAGLVESRQGAGVFVLSASPGFGRFPMAARNQIEDVLFVLELRLAVEVEAAALAASRRTDDDIANMEAALDQLLVAQGAGEAGLGADMTFHQAVAQATQNPYFAQFLSSLGGSAMPRGRLPDDTRPGADMSAYLGFVLSEHRYIKDAIVARDATLAAAAMRSHLAGSRSRYANLLKQIAREKD
ncbi:MAG TPA: FadR/GntR family transcriptional regulator [Devosiaceae bacterium]